jgi:hypothetical protein
MHFHEFTRVRGVIPFFSGAIIITNLSISGSLFGEPFCISIHAVEIVG